VQGTLYGVTLSQEEADMPNGVFPVPEFRPTPTRAGRTRPSFADRWWMRWRRSRLDEQLARDTDPTTSAELGLRAAQLRSSAERSRLANFLVEVLGDAPGPNLGAFRVSTRQRHARIRESADELLALVLRLRDDEPIAVRGAAMTALLVDRRSSPLRHGDGRDLQLAIRAAHVALDERDRGAHNLAAAA
jgi:hypothetical protein